MIRSGKIIILLIAITYSNSCYSQDNQIVFTVDQRTEFFRTIFNLAAEDVIAEKWKPCETDYYKSVKMHFGSYKSHPLIKYVLENDNIKIDFSAIGLMYKDLDSFEFDPEYTQDLKDLGLTFEEVEVMRPMLIDFYSKSNFKQFFEQNQQYYLEATAQLQKQAKDEKVFDGIAAFFQSAQNNLKFIVFVELTNNINNKALSFYDHHNPDIGAVVLANLCDDIDNPTPFNHHLILDDIKKRILYHEVSHLFTNAFLDKHIGRLPDYSKACKDCTDSQVKDFVDHYIVFPLQAVLMKRLNNDLKGEIFYMEKCTDVRKDVYLRLLNYNPQGPEKFEAVYKECIELIRSSAGK